MSGPSPFDEGLDPRIVKALSHPLRYRLLVRLNAGEASPVTMARELGLPIGRVSHHVRILAGIGAIELVRTEPRRGAVEHFYRAAMPAWLTDADWARVPRSARNAIAAQNLQHVLGDVAVATFDHPQAHLSRLPLVLDQEGMSELSDLLASTLERAYEIRAESARRLEEGGPEAGLATELVMLHFERA